MKKFYSLFLLTFIGLGVFAATITLKSTCTATSGGSVCTWTDVNSWDLGRIPISGDVIIIPSGKNVEFNSSPAITLKDVTIKLYGRMYLSGGAKVIFWGNSIIGGYPGASEVLQNPGTELTVGGDVNGTGGTKIQGSRTDAGPFVFRPSGFSAGESPSPTLPVKLTSFTATTSNTFVNLNWETAQENNNKHFELQRSVNGQDWSTITTVAGNGTTGNVSNYTYTDKTPLNGNSFYRLKQVDYDGKFEISKVVAVKLSSIGSLAFDILPNRVVTNFKVVASTDLRTADISIFNTVGNRMNAIISKNGNEANVDVTALSAGQYIIRIQSGSEALTKRFVINK